LKISLGKAGFVVDDFLRSSAKHYQTQVVLPVDLFLSGDIGGKDKTKTKAWQKQCWAVIGGTLVVWCLWVLPFRTDSLSQLLLAPFQACCEEKTWTVVNNSDKLRKQATKRANVCFETQTQRCVLAALQLVCANCKFRSPPHFFLSL
jgi:hypothetical protein